MKTMKGRSASPSRTAAAAAPQSNANGIGLGAQLDGLASLGSAQRPATSSTPAQSGYQLDPFADLSLDSKPGGVMPSSSRSVESMAVQICHGDCQYCYGPLPYCRSDTSEGLSFELRRSMAQEAPAPVARPQRQPAFVPGDMTQNVSHRPAAAGVHVNTAVLQLQQQETNIDLCIHSFR